MSAMTHEGARDVPIAKSLREVRDQIDEAMGMCVDHYVNVCDTVLFRWKAVIEEALHED